MHKPHIKRNGVIWQCVGDGLWALGHSPRVAYAQWLKVWYCRESNPNRAGWEIGR